MWGDECQCACVFVQGYTGSRDKDVMYCSRCLTVAVVRSQEVPVHQLTRRIRSTPLASQTHCNSNTEVSVCVVKLLRYNRNQLPHLLDKGDFQSDKECIRLSYMKLVLFCYWSLVTCPHDYIQYIYHSFKNMWEYDYTNAVTRIVLFIFVLGNCPSMELSYGSKRRPSFIHRVGLQQMDFWVG